MFLMDEKNAEAEVKAESFEPEDQSVTEEDLEKAAGGSSGQIDIHVLRKMREGV